MFNPSVRNRQTWMQHGATLGGIMIAGRCILVFVFFGIGLILMGVIATATSSAFDNFDGKGGNPPRTIGICFLTIGVSLLVLGIVFIIIAKKKIQNINRENDQDPSSTVHVYPGNLGGSGALYSGGPYPPPQVGGAYPPQQGGPYPPQQGGPYPPPQAGGPYPPPQYGGAYPPPHSGGPYPPPQSGGPYPSQPGSQYPSQPAYSPGYGNPQENLPGNPQPYPTGPPANDQKLPYPSQDMPPSATEQPPSYTSLK